jgi:hypothetical protein
MTAGEFIVRAMEQPEGKHYELVAGDVFAMSPERVGHPQTQLSGIRILDGKPPFA